MSDYTPTPDEQRIIDYLASMPFADCEDTFGHGISSDGFEVVVHALRAGKHRAEVPCHFCGEPVPAAHAVRWGVDGARAHQACRSNHTGIAPGQVGFTTLAEARARGDFDR